MITRRVALYKILTKDLLNNESIVEIIDAHKVEIIEIQRNFTILSYCENLNNISKLTTQLSSFGNIEYLQSSEITMSIN